MTDSGRKIKICCASFYESDLVRMLLGDVLHPGGLDLTRHLGQVIGLMKDDSVLDIACGRGTSAVHLSENFGCHVTGLDYSPENLIIAEAHAASSSVSHLTDFKHGDAERLPFRDDTFDVVISECSFCTFPNKKVAAAEMARVLHPGGRLGMTDVTLNSALPEDVQSLLAWIACIAGAGSVRDYKSTLGEAGFTDFIIEDKNDTLKEMVTDIRRKLFGIELAVGLGKLDLGGLDMTDSKKIARRVVQLIEEGTLGYALVAARKTTAQNEDADRYY